MTIGLCQEDLLDRQDPFADECMNHNAIDAGEGLHPARRRTSLPFHTNGLIHSQISFTDPRRANYTHALSVKGIPSTTRNNREKKKSHELGPSPPLLT